eukprot:scaffold435_cov275-Chaetoceros_neogracile.AAC.27
MKSGIKRSLFLVGSTTIFLCLVSSVVSADAEGDNKNEGKQGLTYEEKYENALNDEDTFIETVYTSKLGANIARASGSLSVLSSLILILIIHRSRVGLSTIYHRIMYCMSLADIMSSLAMALGSLLMPKDMIYTQFESAVYGNTTTCTAQGIGFLLGANLVFAYNTALCVYYLCSIRYKMTEASIRKRVEPFFHICAVFGSVSITIYLCAVNLFNPNPWDAWCTAVDIPWKCSYGEFRSKDCSFNSNTSQAALFVIVSEYLLGFACLIASMILITWTVYKQEMLIKSYQERVYGRRRTSSTTMDSNERNNLVSSKSRHHFTKVIAYQALAYVAVFLLCQSNVFIGLTARVTAPLRKDEWTQIYHLVTRPLQGFFNVLVFVAHKIYNLRQARKELTVPQALVCVLCMREEPSFIFSQISIVAGIRHDEGAEDDLYFDGDDDNVEENREQNSELYPYPVKEGIDEREESHNGISYNTDNSDIKDMKDTDLSLAETFEENSRRDMIAKNATTTNSSGKNDEDMILSSGFASVFSGVSSKRSDLSLDPKSWCRRKNSSD